MPRYARRTRLRLSIIVSIVVFGLGLEVAPYTSRPATAASAVRAPAEASTTGFGRAQESAPPSFTIKTRVPLTILDVVVTDANGKPVHGLKQSDFTVLEDNKEMEPNSFEEHRSDEAQPAAPIPVKQDLPPNTFTNVNPAPPRVLPINILLLDALNTPTQAQQTVTKQMLDFLKKMPPGTPMAVFRLTTRLSILQGITTDPELLKAAITKSQAAASSFEDPWRDISNINPLIIEQPGEVVQREGNQTALRAQYEISAMNQIARYLSGMPGRKNLIWFAGSFPLRFPPAQDAFAFAAPTPVHCPPYPQPCKPNTDANPIPMPEIFNFEQDVKSVTDLLARAHVAVYPIDAHGLESALIHDEAPPWAGKNLEFMNNSEHLTMETIAEATGGKAFYNTNGFTEAAQEVLETGSNFYTLTYTPTNQPLDTRFRTIKVKVDQPGLNLTYRNGYYALDPATTFTGKKLEKVSPMQTAMMRGALDATQVLFNVKVAEAPGTEVSLPAHNVPNTRQMKPPYRHYAVTYTIDIHQIDFSPGVDGNYHAAFEYGIRVYNADGEEIVNSASKEARPVLPPVVYQSMLKTGTVSHDEIDVPAKGDYFLCIAVHDLTSDRVGAMEIPTSSITPEAVPAVASGQNP